MIDRPQGKIEQFIVDLCDEAGALKADIGEIIGAAKENIYPLRHLVRIVTALFITACVFYCLNFNDMGPGEVYKTVTVSTYMHPAVMTSEYTTQADTVGEFLSENDIGYDPEEDLISVDMDDPVPLELEISVSKPITVYIYVENQEYEYTEIEGFTVSDALKALNISVESGDSYSMPLDTIMENGDTFNIGRVTLSYEYEEVKLPYETVIVKDKNLICGKVETVKKGKKGTKLKTYVVETRGGVEQKRYLVETKVTKKAQNEVIHYGVNFSNVVPDDLEYIDVIKHVKCVSYNFGSQRMGVYGMDCDYGTAAVDRSVLPLGTKFYVPGYGYCVANDVGSAIKNKKIDLYMPVREQCYIWGAQWRDIYIIEWGNDEKWGAFN